MNDLDVQIKGVASGRIPAGSMVGEALERLAAAVATQALAAKVDGREVDLTFRLQPGDGDAVVEIEPGRLQTIATLPGRGAARA